MRSIELKLYQLLELSPEAQKKALDKQLEIQIEYGDPLWYFTEECQERAAQIGFKDIKLQYSLSNCQGDGLSFSSENIDLEKFIKEALPNCKKSVLTLLTNNLIINLKGNTGRYCFCTSSDLSIEFGQSLKSNYYNIQSLIYQIEAHAQNEYLELCHQLEKLGYSIIEDSQTEESLRELIDENGFEFTADGKRYY